MPVIRTPDAIAAMRARARAEVDRLSSLCSLNLLDTAAEAEFDAIVAEAAGQLKVPIALISLIDADRQWFKARVGLEVQETSRDVAFCHHTIRREAGVLVVPDATQDERFADNPLVTDNPHIRFYAGAAVTAPSGARIGTLCVIDRQPRLLSEAERAVLKRLAAAVSEAIARRNANR